MRPYLEKPFTKNRAGGVAQGEGSEFKTQYHKKKKSLMLNHILLAVRRLVMDRISIYLGKAPCPRAHQVRNLLIQICR
jgi:hypothetical protein